jgi:hypothetical protein
LAEASDRWRCWARKVEMLRARVWWAHLWGFSGGVVVVDGGGVWAFVALGRRPMGATCSWLKWMVPWEERGPEPGGGGSGGLIVLVGVVPYRKEWAW